MRIAILLAMIAVPALPQSFEVASIKPSGSRSFRGSDGGPGTSDPTLYRFGRATVLDLITAAYKVDRFQVSSKTPLDQTLFDLSTRLPDGASKSEFRAMLRNFLVDRFHLEAHIESKEFPAYVLIVGKTGPELKDSASTRNANDDLSHLRPDGPYIARSDSIKGGFQVTRLRAHQQPISQLARMLRMDDSSPVVDKTGLAGNFDFSLEYATEIPGSSGDLASDPGPAPALSVALEKQLGLQIVRKKLPFDVVVVEKVDKLPTPN